MTTSIMTLVEASSTQPWDRAAQGWNQHADLIGTWLRQASSAMLDAAQISIGMSVLDIAAGAGDQTMQIAARIGITGRVLATDVSPGILALAKTNAAHLGFHQVETRLLNAESLGLQGANYDAAVSRLGLMFCHDPGKALVQARSALKPGGRFAALVFSQPQTNPCLTITLGVARHHAGLCKLGDQNEAQVYLPGSLMSLGKPGLFAELLHSAGFVNIDICSINAPMKLASVHHYIEFLKSAASPIIELLSQLTPSAQQAAWLDMTEQLKQFEHGGGWTGPNELLLAKAQAPMS